MVEKDFTEYERDLRDFEKKPLAKDRETLIFPPESNIKGSDKQDASVLPAVPKLSMRKEALLFPEEKKLIDDIASSLGQEAAQQAEDFYGGIRDKVNKDILKFLRRFLSDRTDEPSKFLKERIEEYLIASASNLKSKKLAVGDKILTSTKKKLSMRETSSIQKSTGHKKGEIHHKASIYKTAAVCPDCLQEMRDHETVSCTKEYINLGGKEYLRDTSYFDVNERCHDCNIVNEAGNIHHYGCDIERCPICEGQLISCGHADNDTYVFSKTSSKKISVNDKILTSTKKKAKVVKVSDDIVFWVSIDGEKDFGSDFVEDIEPFEAHEPFEEHSFGRGRNLREDGDGLGRGRREPVDEGITKEIPLEEKVDLASKNRRKKKADDDDEYEDEYQLWVNYGPGMGFKGWEYEIAESTLEEAQQRQREYKENVPQYPTKIVHKRVPLANTNRRKKKADYEDYDEYDDEFADIEGSPSASRIIDEIEKDWNNFEKIYSQGNLTAADALSKWLEDEDRDYAVHVSEFDLVLAWLLREHNRFATVKHKTVKKAVADVWLGEPETCVADLEEFNIKLDGQTPLYILYNSTEHDFPVVGNRPVSEEDMERLYQENEEREEEEI